MRNNGSIYPLLGDADESIRRKHFHAYLQLPFGWFLITGTMLTEPLALFHHPLLEP